MSPEKPETYEEEEEEEEQSSREHHRLQYACLSPFGLQKQAALLLLFLVLFLWLLESCQQSTLAELLVTLWRRSGFQRQQVLQKPDGSRGALVFSA